MLHHVDTGETELLATPPVHPTESLPGLSLSPDGRFAVSVNVESSGANIMMIENLF